MYLVVDKIRNMEHSGTFWNIEIRGGMCSFDSLNFVCGSIHFKLVSASLTCFCKKRESKN